jgi:hypothetical protein
VTIGLGREKAYLREIGGSLGIGPRIGDILKGVNGKAEANRVVVPQVVDPAISSLRHFAFACDLISSGPPPGLDILLFGENVGLQVSVDSNE